VADAPRRDDPPVRSKQKALDLFWLFGAPAGLVALLLALGAHL